MLVWIGWNSSICQIYLKSRTADYKLFSKHTAIIDHIKTAITEYAQKEFND